jgi:hypothetical protein
MRIPSMPGAPRLTFTRFHAHHRFTSVQDSRHHILVQGWLHDSTPQSISSIGFSDGCE